MDGAMRLRCWGLALTLAALGALPALPAEGKDDLPKRRLSPEFKYVDEGDDEAAAAMLPRLLKKYADPKKCRALLKVLRTKRSYPKKMPRRRTLKHVCLDGKTREFTWILPKRYSRTKPCGVLIFLHGAISQPAPGGGANEAGMFSPAVKELGLIVVGPSTYDRVEWGTPACRGLIHHTLEVLKQYFNIDEDRVFLAGDSDGGRGTYALLETETTFFAAAVPVIGSPGGVTRYANLRNLPIFAINGETDSIFKIDGVRRAVEGMQASGIDLTWKLVAGKGHDPRFFLTYKEEVCAFLKEHPREPFPKRVHWQVDASAGEEALGFPADTIRWLRIGETGSSTSRGEFEDGRGGLIQGNLPRVEGAYEGNRIDIKTRGVKTYSVLISDEMLDLSKEIEIHTNGKLSYRGRVEPDAGAILEEARRFKDRKLVWVNRVEVTVDAEAALEAGEAR